MSSTSFCLHSLCSYPVVKLNHSKLGAPLTYTLYPLLYHCGEVSGIFLYSSIPCLPLYHYPLIQIFHVSFLETPRSWHLRSGEEKAFQFYNSCMDTDTIESAGAGPLQQVIEEVRKTGVLVFLSNSYDQCMLEDSHDFLECRSFSQGLQVLGGRQK